MSGEPEWAHVSGWSQGPDDFHSISCVIVARNVAASLSRMLPVLSDELTEIGYPWEITCVDCASTDRTPSLLEAWSEIPGFCWIRLARNCGVVAATHAGLSRARGDAIIVLNAGAEPKFVQLPNLVAKWRNGSSIVVVRDPEHRGESVVSWNMDDPLAVGEEDEPGGPSAIQALLLDRCVVDRLLRGGQS